MRPITSPHIRDTITIDGDFALDVAGFAGPDPLVLVARLVDQQAELRIGARSVVIVADEFRGNGQLVNAAGTGSPARGADGASAGPTPPIHEGAPGEGGGTGGGGGPGGSVTVMCRRSSGVRIVASGGAGAPGGNGGNGGAGSPATSTPVAPIKTTVFDSEGIPHEELIEQDPIETPATLGGLGGSGGTGGAGGSAGTIAFTSVLDETPPFLEAAPGPGGPGGAGGVAGANGLGAEIPEGFDPSPVAGDPGAAGADGSLSATTVAEEDYLAVLRPLLDGHGPLAATWAAHRLLVGQHRYRQHRRSNPTKGQEAEAELRRALELQPADAEALRWLQQLTEVPRPRQQHDQDLGWEPGGLNALGFPRDLDVLPQFKAYRDAFTGFGSLVLSFLNAGEGVLLTLPTLETWASFLEEQRRQALAAQDTTVEDRELATTEARIATETLDDVQARLDQTTRDLEAALAADAMRHEEVSIGGVLGSIASIAGAVVAVVAAVPTGGVSLVALVPSMVALSSTVVANAEPIAQALFAGEKPKTDAIKAAYGPVKTQVADVVKAAQAIVSFVDVIEKLTAQTTAANSTHMDLVRRGVELTHELLLARHRVTLAQQRLDASDARIARAAAAVNGIDGVGLQVVAREEALRRTGLNAIAIAESKADALLTLAFHAQRSVEIYTLTDQEDEVRLESGHLDPDLARDFAEGRMNVIELVGRLGDCWRGLLEMIDLELAFNRFTTRFHDHDRRRLSFRAGSAEIDSLRATGRLSFHLDPTSLPADHVDAKVQGVRVALVGATAPTSEVTVEVRHGSSYETRRLDGTVETTVLQPRRSNRDATLEPLVADEGLGADPLLTDPQSLAFWGRGVGGDYEVVVPDHELDAGLDLTGLTEVQVWIGYQYLQ
ncbi:MAG: hypothetical protein U0R80_05680 [Nocardioidaceae bacterium]